MRDERDITPIRIALNVDDSDLRARLSDALSGIAEVDLVAPDETADLHLSTPPEDETAMTGPELTPREAEVLLMMAEGASNREIAERLGVSFHTAKFHVQRVMEKLDATGRVDAVTHAARIGVIHL